MSVDPPVPADPGRRRLLTLLGGGGVLALVAADPAHGGHDGTNVLHLGQGNSVPAGQKTGVASDVDAFSVDVDNFNTGATAGGLHARSLGSLPAVQGVATGLGVFGVSSGEAGFGKGPGNGVAGLTGSGSGAYGESETGFGVEGRHTGEVEDENCGGVFGHSIHGSGVRARSENSAAIETSSPNGPGLIAFAGMPETGPDVPAVLGLGFSGHGVHGQTERSDRAGVCGAAMGCLERGPCPPGTGTGVLGTSEAGVGVEARSESGMALKVSGPAGFASAGSGLIPAGASSGFVSEPLVTATSHVSVTLASDPGQRGVRWVQRVPGVGFHVHLDTTVLRARPQTAFTYLVVEPA